MAPDWTEALGNAQRNVTAPAHLDVAEPERRALAPAVHLANEGAASIVERLVRIAEGLRPHEKTQAIHKEDAAQATTNDTGLVRAAHDLDARIRRAHTLLDYIENTLGL